jgi:hypothetical protein
VVSGHVARQIHVPEKKSIGTENIFVGAIIKNWSVLGSIYAGVTSLFIGI